MAHKIEKETSTKIELSGYEDFLRDLKNRIRSSQIKAAFAVNRELIELYWEIGKNIVERQEKAAWGDEILEHLSKDLKQEFPEMEGFSRRNLYRMRAFYKAYKEQSEFVAQVVRQISSDDLTNVPQTVGLTNLEHLEFVPQLVAQIPWGHNIVIIEKIKNPKEREWYLQQTSENGWSRAVLTHQIETKLYQR